MASDLIAGSAGTVSRVALAMNGAFLADVLTNVSKASSGTSILKPYDFSATFQSTLTGVELQPGVNLFQLTALNAYGLAGFAEQAVEIWVQGPAPQPYEYELRVTDDPYSNASLSIGIELRTRPADGAWSTWRMLSRQDGDTFSGTDPALGSIILDVSLVQPLDGTGPNGKTWVTLIDPATENKGEAIELRLDRLELLDGVQKAIWKGEWTREDHDLESLSRHNLILGPSSPLVFSEGGQFHPVLLGIDGPAGLGDFMDQVTIGESTYDLMRYDNRLVFALPDTDVPRAFLSTVNFSLLNGPPDTPIDDTMPIAAAAGFDVADFTLGIGAGLVQTIPDTVVGLWDGVKFLVKQTWHNLPPRMIYRLVTTGNPLTVEDQRRWATVGGVAVKVAEVVWKITQDQHAFLYALQTGDEQTLNALGQEYRVAFEFAAEMLDALWNDLAGLPDYEKGKIVGRILGEVVLTVASAGVGAVAKGATMGRVAAKLKQVSYLQRFAGKFDELIILYNRIDSMVESVEYGATRGKAIAQRIASILAYYRYKTSKGAWEAFEQFLSVTNDVRRKAVVDSHLGYATNMVVREAYKEAADVLRRGGTLSEAMAKVPTHRRVAQAMAGRREAAFLESHHTATKEWTRKLLPRQRCAAGLCVPQHPAGGNGGRQWYAHSNR